MSKKKPRKDDNPQSAIRNPQSKQGDLLPTPEPETGRETAESKKRAYEPNPIVTEVPATCPRCGSTKSKVTHTAHFPNRPLAIKNVIYPGRTCRRRICAECRCRYISNAPIDQENATP